MLDDSKNSDDDILGKQDYEFRRLVRNLLGGKKTDKKRIRYGLGQGARNRVHTLHRQHWEDLLIDFVLGKEIKAGVKRGGMGEVGENQIS